MSLADWNAVQCGVAGELGWPVRANVVQYDHRGGQLLLASVEPGRRHRDRQVEHVLDLGGVRRAVRERHRRQEPLRRVRVVELVRERRRRTATASARRTARCSRRSRRCRARRARGRGSGSSPAGTARRTAGRAPPGCRASPGSPPGRPRRGIGPVIRSVIADEQPPLVVVGALHDRHAVELAARERGADRLGQELVVDRRAGAADAAGLVREHLVDRQAAQAGGGLIGAAGGGRERRAGGLGGGEAGLGQLVRAALDDRALEQARASPATRAGSGR